MVSLEVGIDARGVVQGSAQSMSALNGIARLAREVTDAIGGTEGAMAAFGLGITKAMPWLTAASAALAGISTVMLLVSRSTQQATSDWDRLAESMRKTQVDMAAAGMVGLPTSPGMTRMASNQLSGLSSALSQRRAMPLSELASAAGMSVSEIAESISTFSPNFYAATQQRQDHGAIMVSATDQSMLFQERYNYWADRSKSQSFSETRGALPAYPGLGRDGYREFSLVDQLPVQSRGFNGVSMDPYQQTIIDNQISQAQDKERQKALEETLRTAMQISDTLADGATNFAFGLSSARDVAVSMLYELSRGLSREAFGALTKSIVNSFSQTAAQSGS